MSHLSNVPKEPAAAFAFLLARLQERAESFPATGQLKTGLQTEAMTVVRALQAIRPRLRNPDDYSAPLVELANTVKGNNPGNARAILAGIEQLFLANSFDDHFIDNDHADLYDTVDWETDDRTVVLNIFAKARALILHSEEIEESRKDRATHFIHRAEIEVRKTKGRWSTFLGATEEAMRVVKDNSPSISQLIMDARTTTHRNVTEVKQIEQAEKPKQIEHKDPKDK